MKNKDQLNFNIYDGLFEQICSMNNLYAAFKEVKKNRGAAGVDDVTISDFEQCKEQNIRQLKQEVENWQYKPSPAKRVEIPKPNGGIRKLGIPTVRDRVLHASIKIAIEPIFDPEFSDNSYGFRPGRNQEMAVKAARDIVATGKEYVVDMDLSKFFDRIHHDRLIYRIGLKVEDKRVLRLIGILLRAGVLEEGKLIKPKEGSPQGSPLSPLLSNIVLDELDKELERRGLEFCRFADDSNIFVGSLKAAKRVKASITEFIERKLKLVVNVEKTKVAKAKFVKFLGMTILGLSICISLKSMDNAMAKVKELTPRGTNMPIEKSIDKITTWYNGWANYYKMTEYPAQLKKIEAHIRRRLRARFVKQQKRRRHLYKKFIKMGAKRKTAANAAFSNNGVWAMSNMGAAVSAYPTEWFRQLGLVTFSDRQLSHWKSIKEWVRLS